MIAGLPDLIDGAKATARALHGPRSRQAHGYLSSAYQLAAHTAVHLAQEDLARSALERAMANADRAEDPVPLAAGCTGLSWVLLRQNEPALAGCLALATADELDP